MDGVKNFAEIELARVAVLLQITLKPWVFRLNFCYNLKCRLHIMPVLNIVYNSEISFCVSYCVHCSLILSGLDLGRPLPGHKSSYDEGGRGGEGEWLWWCGETKAGPLFTSPVVLPPSQPPDIQDGRHSTHQLRGGPSDASSAQSESSDLALC